MSIGLNICKIYFFLQISVMQILFAAIQDKKKYPHIEYRICIVLKHFAAGAIFFIKSFLL